MNYKFQIQKLVGNLYGIKFDEAEEEKRLEDEEDFVYLNNVATVSAKS